MNGLVAARPRQVPDGRADGWYPIDPVGQLPPHRPHGEFLYVAVAGLALLLAATLTTAVPRFSSPTAAKAPEGVVNPSASVDMAGWISDGDVTRVRLMRIPVAHHPARVRTAVDIRRTGVVGKWAMAFAKLKSPATFFQVGRSYRMQVYVRDVNASGQRIGVLLGNENFGHRPTAVSRYESFDDDSWHLVTRTFLCTDPAFADTGLFLDLPPAGELHWQVTAASVREVPTPRPPRVLRPATRTLSFDGTAGTPPDPLTWNHEVGGHGWGNGELQTYTESKANAQVDGAGHLRITALRQQATGRDGITRQYTSARLTTQGKVNVRPGSYVEATLSAPGGTGVWPAFWLLGTNISEIGWPACGELDVVEVVGSRPTVAHSMTHMATAADPRKDAPYPLDESKGMVELGHPLDSQAHRYGVYFDRKMVRFYVDRKEHLALGADDALAAGRNWPFDKPQYLLLNIAVGGKGDPSRTEFPKSMIVDRISIWEGGTPF
jgi:hypothetical protein